MSRKLSRITRTNIDDMGAISDGSTNNYDVFKTAFKSQSSLVFNEGTYRVEFNESNIDIPFSGILNIEGVGIDKTIIKVGPESPSTNSNLFNMINSGVLNLSNLTLSGPDVLGASGSSNPQVKAIHINAISGITNKGSTDIILSNVKINGNFFECVAFDSGADNLMDSNLILHNCDLKGAHQCVTYFRKQGVHQYKAYNTIFREWGIASGELTSPAGHGNYVHPNVSVLMDGCRFIKDRRKDSQRYAIRQFGSAPLEFPAYSIYNNCIFESGCSRAIQTTERNNVNTVISNTTIDDCNVIIRSPTNVIGCTVRNNAQIKIESMDEFNINDTIFYWNSTIGGQSGAIVKVNNCSFLYRTPYAVWASGHDYIIGEHIVSTNNLDHIFECIQAGTSATTEPNWPSSGIIVDNSITWQFISSGTTSSYIVDAPGDVQLNNCRFETDFSLNAYVKNNVSMLVNMANCIFTSGTMINGIIEAVVPTDRFMINNCIFHGDGTLIGGVVSGGYIYGSNNLIDSTVDVSNGQIPSGTVIIDSAGNSWLMTIDASGVISTIGI